MTEWLLVLLGVGLTVGTALFVATEFSLVALDRPTVQKAVDAGDAGREVGAGLAAPAVDPAVRGAGRHHADHPGPRFPRHPVDGRAPAMARSGPLGLSGATASTRWPRRSPCVIATVFSMVVRRAAAAVPRHLRAAARRPRSWRCRCACFALVARPLIVVLNGSANLFLRALGITPQEELSGARTPQELASLVRALGRGGHARRGHRAARHALARTSASRPPPT